MTQNYSDEANLVNNSLEAQYLKKISIVDNVTTNDSTLPLSAKQGKYLYDTFNSYKSTLVSKLNDLGVTNVSVNDTWSSLLNAIPASVGGIDVVTAISCNVSNTNITVNEQITISGVLEADKDDTSSDNVDLEGYLKGATVKIYNGQTLIGTTTTDSNGAYSYNYTPTSEGTLSILALFEGTDDYEQCSSSSTTVTVTTLKTLTLISDKDILSYADNDSATLTATYKENGVGVANKEILFGLPSCNVVKNTSSGVIEPNLNIGNSFSLEFVDISYQVNIQSTDYSFRVDSNYDVIIYPNNNPIVLFNCDGYLKLKDGILSDNDGHSVDISSYDNDFNIKYIFSQGTVYIDCIGHGLSDSNGEVDVSYASQGIGDISFYAKSGSLVSETYDIEDCIDYDALTSASDKWTIPSNAGTRYTNNGMTLTASSWADLYFNNPINTPCSFEFDLIDYSASSSNTPYFAFYLWNAVKSTRLIQFTNGNNNKLSLQQYGGTTNETNYTSPKNSHIRLEINNNKLTAYVDDIEKISYTYNMPSEWILGIASGANRSLTWKNMKIKPL